MLSRGDGEDGVAVGEMRNGGGGVEGGKGDAGQKDLVAGAVGHGLGDLGLKSPDFDVPASSQGAYRQGRPPCPAPCDTDPLENTRRLSYKA